MRTAADGTKWQPYMENGYLGVKNDAGKIIIPAKFTYVDYERGSFTVKDNCGLIGKYTRDGKVVFPPCYHTVYEIDGVENSPYIVVGDGYGLVDCKGKVLLEDVYTSIQACVDNNHRIFFKLWKDGHMGIADLGGNIIITPDKYNIVYEILGEGNEIFFAYMIFGGGSGVCNERGETIIHTDYYQTITKGKGEERYYEVLDGNRIGKIDLDGNVIAPISGKTKERISQVVSGGKIFTIWRDELNKCFVKDPAGKIIIPAVYDDVSLVHNYFVVKDGQFMGVINNNGNVIVHTDKHYVSVALLEGSIVAKTLDDRRAIYDYGGRCIFPAIHKTANLHLTEICGRNDTLISYKDRERCWGIKDLKGNILVQPMYDGCGFLDSEYGFYFYVFKNGKVGLQDVDGKIIFEPEYTDITVNKKSPFFFIDTGGYMGVADLGGNMIISPEIFEEISYNPKTKHFTGTAGKRKCVFSQDGKLLSDNFKQKEEYTNLADAEFEKKNYKKAAELYGKALEASTSAVLYFNRGVSYYNANKYNKAIADFRMTLNSKPSERLRDRSLDLIEKAEHYQALKECNQMQLVSAIFGLAMSGVNYAIQSKSEKPRGASYQYSYSNDSYSSDDNTPQTRQRKEQICGFCGGKGSTVEYVSNFGIDEQPWCDECGKKVVSGHYHKTCTHCNGTGKR